MDYISMTAKEIVHISRLALKGDTASSAAFIRRTAKRLSASDPELADALIEMVSAHHGSVMRHGSTAPVIPTDADTRLHLVRFEEYAQLPTEPTWPSTIGEVLQDVLKERERADLLISHGLTPSRSMLLTGPPGVGKTLAARWLARELSLPLVTLDLAAVMSSYLGRTGGNLRSVLEFASQAPCVLLLDEFDAIAKRRADDVEVGELKRLVTVLLQAIDDWPAHSLLLAATNHPELLDPAVWRRFDVVLEFPLPTYEDLCISIGRHFSGQIQIEQPLIKAAAKALAGRSFAGVDLVIQRALRNAMVRDIDPAEAVRDIIALEAQKLPRAERIELAAMLAENGLSQREVNRLTGVSRDTIRKRSNQHGEDHA